MLLSFAPIYEIINCHLKTIFFHQFSFVSKQLAHLVMIPLVIFFSLLFFHFLETLRRFDVVLTTATTIQMRINENTTTTKQQIKIRNKWCQWRLIYILVIFNAHWSFSDALFAANARCSTQPNNNSFDDFLFRHSLHRIFCSCIVCDVPSSSFYDIFFITYIGRDTNSMYQFINFNIFVIIVRAVEKMFGQREKRFNSWRERDRARTSEKRRISVLFRKVYKCVHTTQYTHAHENMTKKVTRIIRKSVKISIKKIKWYKLLFLHFIYLRVCDADDILFISLALGRLFQIWLSVGITAVTAAVFSSIFLYRLQLVIK